MMEELVSMHMEYVRYYGPDKKNWPDWMNWTELDRLHMDWRRIIWGEEREELSGWMPLYRFG
jgi:integrator complex subunit 9